MVHIGTKLFNGKKTLPWDNVEYYLKQYIDEEIEVYEYKDIIKIPRDFPDEYSHSVYTKKLHGTVAIAKANAILKLKDIISSATNRRYVENKDKKHIKDASLGWYRYDIFFSISVKGENEKIGHLNLFRGTLVVRINENGNELYDIVNIKKEASKPLEP